MGDVRMIWQAPASGWNSTQLWAPEIHFIGGHWYVYYSASEIGKSSETHRAGVLRSTTDDVFSSYEDMGMFYTGDNPDDPSTNMYALDMTVFQHKEKLYAVWSSWKDMLKVGQHLFIQEMENPYTFKPGKRVLLSSPVESWEIEKNGYINEGPEILKNGEQVFIIYSCHPATEASYCLGMLQLCHPDSNVVAPSNWVKKGPVFSGTKPSLESGDATVFGVGHCSFTKSADNTENWIVYHSKKSGTSGWPRDVRMQPFSWNEDGTPDFGIPVPTGGRIKLPSGELTPGNSFEYQLINLPLDFNLKDASGNHLNAENAGTAPVEFVLDSVRGRVACFKNKAYAVLPKNDSLKFGNSDFSFALWLKCKAVPEATSVLSNKNELYGAEKGFSFFLDNPAKDGSKLWGVNIADGDGNQLNWFASDNGAASIADDNWHFIAVSFSRDKKMDIYLDGKLLPNPLDMSLCPGSAYDEVHGSTVSIMKGLSSISNYAGYAGQAMFWKWALTADEVAKLYTIPTTNFTFETVFLPLDDDLKDASGNGFDATDAGAVATTFVNDTERGKVAHFERTAHAVLPKVDPLRFGTKDFSFSIWVKCAPAPYDPVIVGNKNWGVGRNKGFAFYTAQSNKTSGSHWAVNLADGETFDGGSGENLRWFAKDNGVPAIADNKWHFVAVSFDRDRCMDIYFDGKKTPGFMDITPCQGYAHDDVNDYPVTLMQDGTGKYYMDIPADLDEFRIWNRTLTSAEVEYYYSSNLKTAAPTETTLPQNSISLYPNPANGAVNVAFNAEGFGETSIMVYNNTGVLVKRLSAASMPGENKTSFSIGGWVPGIYLVRVVSGAGSETARLVVSD